MSVFRASNASTDNHTPWSVPHPRPAYTDLYDDPTERLYEAEIEPEPAGDQSRRARRGGTAFAVVLAVLALIASAGASLIAWRALAVASTRPAGAPTAPAAPATLPSAAPALSGDPALSAGAPLDPSAGASPDPSAGASAAGYPLSYAQEPLKVQVGCAAVMYLDLDEPRADAEQQQSDLRYDSRCGTDQATLTLAPGAEAGSQVTGPDIDAPGCDKAIRTSPLGAAAGIPVRKGTVLCVLTSAIDAEDRGDRPHIVLIEVTDVSTDGTAGMRATSWTVP